MLPFLRAVITPLRWRDYLRKFWLIPCHLSVITITEFHWLEPIFSVLWQSQLSQYVSLGVCYYQVPVFFVYTTQNRENKLPRKHVTELFLVVENLFYYQFIITILFSGFTLDATGSRCINYTVILNGLWICLQKYF